MKVKDGYFLLDALASTVIVVILVSIISTAAGALYLQHSANMNNLKYNAVIESKLSDLSGNTASWSLLPASEIVNNVTFTYTITQTDYYTTQLCVGTSVNTTTNNFIIEVPN